MRFTTWITLSLLATASVAVADEWTQFLGNPQHTGSGKATFAAISNPKVLWKTKLDERPMTMAHPALVGGTLYIGNMDGKLVALDAENGQAKWTYSATGPIGVCPAVVDGRVHFGSYDGFQYCLDTSGKLLWKFASGDVILSAPCVVDGKVFFGNNAGRFVALDAASGKVEWEAAAGERIISNPAYFDGRVYFASDDMFAYAYNATDGTLAWKRKLTGESNRWNSPTVVTEAKAVLFTSVPHQAQSGMGLKDLYSRYYLGHVALRNGKWSHHPYTLTEALTGYETALAQAPDQRSAHLLDAATGEPRTAFFVKNSKSGEVTKINGLPMNLWYHNANNRPIVYQDRYILFQAFGNILKIDAVGGEITETYSNGLARGDEYTPITVWGDTVYAAIAGNMASLDLKTNQRRQVRGVYGVERADFVPMDSRVGRWGGGTGDGGSSNSSFIIIHNGRLYYSLTGWVYCFDGVQSDTPEPRPWETQQPRGGGQ